MSVCCEGVGVCGVSVWGCVGVSVCCECVL